MIDVDNRKLLGLSCAAQLVTHLALTILQHILGHGFCLKTQECITKSVKILLINIFISIIVGWISTGTFVLETGNDSASKNRRRKVISLIKAMFITFCGSFVFHFITILYGAPFIQNMAETYLFSCIMSVMTLLHLMLISNGRWWTIIQIIDFKLYKSGKIVDNVRLISFLTIIGAMLGSAAIPLDWDRPWQAWPVPCCVGAAIGYTTGLVIFIIVPVVEYAKWRHERSKMKFY